MEAGEIMIITDGAVCMHILKLAVYETFDDYTIMCLVQFGIPYVDSVGPVDIGFDATTRRRKGMGQWDMSSVVRCCLQTGQNSCKRMTTHDFTFTMI